MALSAEPSEDDESDLVKGFRQAWYDAMTGKSHPASILWEDNFWDAPNLESYLESLKQSTKSSEKDQSEC